MALITKAVKGTQDILPADSYKWQHVERVIEDVCRAYGYKEIRTPVFEHTELFQRSVGNTTDVVQKEMYTFNDKGGRSITLRPEGTAGVARAVLEHGLQNGALPLKTYYFTSCYRYEKPQAGRLREFHQFGVELYGASSPTTDAEIICLANEVLTLMGIKNLQLEINSIGCPECRAKYHEALKEYFSAYADKLCATCNDRLQRNPMRILDCKSPVCHEIASHAPVILDYICDDCRKHFDSVKANLDAVGIKYTVNPTIVRGLDYYTRTVFEFVSGDLGAQSTVCGGGRYDGLIQELSGQSVPGIGFAMGLERLMLILEAQGVEIPNPNICDIYIASMGEKAANKAFEIVTNMRAEGFAAECDLMGRSVKAQMKYADKIGAKFSVVLGDNELEAGKAILKNMADGTTCEVALDNELLETIYRFQIDSELANFSDSFADENISALAKGLIDN